MSGWALPWRLARRDLRGGLAGFRLFLACLALGVAAIAAIASVRAAIEAGLAREGAALLGGDAEIALTYRFASEEERAWMEARAERLSETVDFRSMIVTEHDGMRDQALTQLRAVDAAYPLVGAVSLAPAMPLAEALAGDGARPGIVMEQALADRLALAPGDTLRLGTQDFVFSAVLLRYPDNSGGGMSLGPRSIVLTKALAESSLLSPGTLFDTAYRLDLPEGASFDALKAEMAADLGQSGLRWRDARAGAPGIAAFVDRLGAFLVLIGLSGLAVGGVGISAAVRAYLAQKAPVIATLKTLGATRRIIFRLYFLEIGVLSLLGIAIGLALGLGLPLLLAPLLEGHLPIPAVFGLYGQPAFEAALYGALAALIFTLWPLARAEETQPAGLYRDALGGARWPAPRYLLIVAALVAGLVAAAALLSGSWQLTLWTFGGIAAALALLALAGLALQRLARIGKRAAPSAPLRWALAAIGARGGEAVPVVLSIGLGLSVLATVGQIDGTLRRAITGQLPDIAPSYFVVDIQPDQIDPLRSRVMATPGVARFEAAPMLRGIITRINGAPAREAAGAHWVLEGDRGVTYTEAMPEGTNLTAGRWWPEGYDGPNQISFAAQEGAELDLRLGDQLTVNILGRDIDAEITSFREVAFENAGINFIMSMNPAALRGAPHSWIATIYAEEAAEAGILRDISRSYPNITAIRVRDGIAQAARLLGGIADATRIGAAISLATGLLVLIGAALAGERGRVFEAAVLKTLGASRGQILRSFAWRAALLGLAAGLVALGAGALGGWAIARFVMEIDYALIWPNALLVIGAGLGTSLLIGLLFALRPLSAKPARILRARD